ncbi:MAG: sensor histidine kinase [Lachnospiraceae bacterium]|nr:sensor histidine kinase [Lachnospiraceae bacterium]
MSKMIMEIKTSGQLYRKLFYIDTVILCCVVLAMTVSFFSSTRNRFLEQNLNYMEMMSESADSYLEETSDIAEYVHEDLYKSGMELNDALHYLTDGPADYQKYRLDTYYESNIKEYKGIETFFLDGFQAYQSLQSIMLYSYERGVVTEYTRDGKSYKRFGDKRFLERLEQGDLVEENCFFYLKEIRDPVNMQVKGCMLLGFGSGKFENIRRYYSKAELAVYNDAGTRVFDSNGKYKASDIMKAEKAGTLENFLGAYVEQTQNGRYHTISYLEKSRASAVPAPVILMILLMGLGTLALGEVFVRYHLKRLESRLNRILDGMTKVMEGDLNVRIPSDRNGDELDVISGYFNEMCMNLEEHINKQYLAEIEQKNAEMAALQSQINPHFLYNTLEAVRMKAICNGDREVGKMLYSLAVTFRAQLKEADVITLAQELHYSKKYMELFEFRYPGQFKTILECPEKYLKIPVIKFVLQPIIENYFIHGIRMKEKDNFIRISVEKEEGTVRIAVEDNGTGITREELAAKNRELAEDLMERQGSIGIANVNRRLKAVYGKAYGIQMEERPGGGLRVILRFPVRAEPEENRED